MKLAVDYFTELFTSSNPPSYEPVLQSIRPKVTEAMNRSLTFKITKEEVRETIYSINPESAPGPYGFSSLFFQKFWPSIGESVTKEILEVFESGKLPEEWNYTYLCAQCYTKQSQKFW